MVKYAAGRLDASFAALSDPTRRGVLEQLGRADASISDLADKFHMTLAGMMKHVGILEEAELVTTEKVGRVRTCKLGAHRLEEETAWLERHRQLWDSRFHELDEVVEQLKYPAEKVKLILNRYDPSGSVSAQAIQTSIKHPLLAEIPRDDRAVGHSIQQGLPYVMSNPRNEVSAAVARLARSFTGTVVGDVRQPAQSARSRCPTCPRWPRPGSLATT